MLKGAAKFLVCAVFFSFMAGAALAAEDDGTIRARAVFIGDVMAHEQQLTSARRGESWDFKPQFRRVKPLFWNCLAVGNLETVFAGSGPYTGYPTFNTPDALADALADLEIDVLSLANNHIMDKRAKAAARTASVLDGAGIIWTGLSPPNDPDEPLVVEYAGLRWAFVNYSYGSNRPISSVGSGDLALNVMSDGAITSGLARAAEHNPDVTVALFHWGAEYQQSPSKGQRRVAELCLRNGADAVIGTHPHVLQPVEVVENGGANAVVAYSLGNFISYQRTKPRERSCVLALDFEKKPGERARLLRVSAAPTWVSARRDGGRLKIETVYAGEGGRFNHAGLPKGELASARAAGRASLEFLGVRGKPDADGFYTIWEEKSRR